MDVVNQVRHFGSKNDFGVVLLCLSCTCFSFVFQLGLSADDEDAFRNYGGFFLWGKVPC